MPRGPARYQNLLWFAAGVLAGVFGYQAVQSLGRSEIPSPNLPDQQSIKTLATLYDPDLDVNQALVRARREAAEDERILMVTFGANWCDDCRNLHRQLADPEVRRYADRRFVLLNVDVGKLNQNRDVAEALGVSLDRGIPVAVFFAPDGSPIGSTSKGELEPARIYTSKQILRFLKDIAERQLVRAPNAI